MVSVNAEMRGLVVGCFLVRPAKLRAQRFLEAFMVRHAHHERNQGLRTNGFLVSQQTAKAGCVPGGRALRLDIDGTVRVEPSKVEL